MVYGYAKPIGRDWGAHTLAGEKPQFAALKDRDFRLLPSSSAIDAGLSDPAVVPTVDKTGAVRPQGEGVDIGAYEGPVADGADERTPVVR